jgi:hypothetical protein
VVTSHSHQSMGVHWPCFGPCLSRISIFFLDRIYPREAKLLTLTYQRHCPSIRESLCIFIQSFSSSLSQNYYNNWGKITGFMKISFIIFPQRLHLALHLEQAQILKTLAFVVTINTNQLAMTRQPKRSDDCPCEQS